MRNVNAEPNTGPVVNRMILCEGHYIQAKDNQDGTSSRTVTHDKSFQLGCSPVEGGSHQTSIVYCIFKSSQPTAESVSQSDKSVQGHE